MSNANLSRTMGGLRVSRRSAFPLALLLALSFAASTAAAGGIGPGTAEMVAPAGGATSSPARGACESITTSLLHVGVAAEPFGDTCEQECPSAVNLNVAVSITGDVDQCSETFRADAYGTPPSLLPCSALPDVWGDLCRSLEWGILKAVNCILRPSQCGGGGPSTA